MSDIDTSSLVDTLVTDSLAVAGARPYIAFALHVGGLNHRKDLSFIRSLAVADVVYPDGISVVALARIAGARHVQRASLTDIGWDVIARMSQVLGRRPRVALLGGADGLSAGAGTMLETYGEAEIVAAEHGYHKDWSPVLERLRALEPDVLAVGLSQPVEIAWVARYRAELPSCLILTVGGWFGHIVGDEKRAPELLRKVGAEWAFRAAQQPRLVPRYAKGVANTAALAYHATLPSGLRSTPQAAADILGVGSRHPSLPAPRTSPEEPSDRAPVGMPDSLRTLAQVLWGDDGRMTVSRGSRLPDGRHLVDKVLVVPSLAKPAFVVPMRSRIGGTWSLLRYGALRPVPTRLARTAVGAAVAMPGVAGIVGDVLTVHAPTDVVLDPTSDLDRATFAGFLEGVLSTGPVMVAVGVPAPRVNAKPTFQLFDASGTPLGFAKMGWTEATAHLVRAEEAALRELDARRFRGFLYPKVVWSGEWQGLPVVVTSPLPQDMRRLGTPTDPQVDAVAALTRSGGGPVAGALVDQPWWQRVVAESERPVHDDADGLPVAEGLRRWIDVIGTAYGSEGLFAGPWHGDWVPWNMARSSFGLAVWDWEHAATSAPVGFDVLHHAFQVAVVLRGRSTDEGMVAVDVAAGRYLPALDVPPDQRQLVGLLYLVEMVRRQSALKHADVPWVEGMLPDLIAGIDRRLETLAKRRRRVTA